jgi:alkylated DNA repair dioxygenase AlkB
MIRVVELVVVYIINLMIKHTDILKDSLIELIKAGHITHGGNVSLKIYGLLTCKSGKRMKKINRVFFESEQEALELGYRPCGHCLPVKYLEYKQQSTYSKNLGETIVNKFGGVTYLKAFYDTVDAVHLYDYLFKNIPWVNDTAFIYGKRIITKRQIAWFADKEFNYNYSGSSRIALPWENEMLKVRQKLEKITGYSFNSCLLNLYPTGQEGMAWHGDDQNHLEAGTPVACISLGAERYFKLRLNSDKTMQHKIMLEQGSLLMMLGELQEYWQHEIPKMAAIKEPRISLTFRCMKQK